MLLMIVRHRPGPLALMFIVRGTILTAVYPQLIILLLFSLLIQLAYVQNWLALPTLSSSPFALLGVAMSIFLSFRNSAAYGRWWEGRMQWGHMVDEVRSLARSSESLLHDDKASRRALLMLIAGYFHGLRGQLRRTDVSSELNHWLGSARAAQALKHGNVPDYCLREAGRLLGRLYREEKLDSIGLQMLDKHLSILAGIQAACERLSNTPLPFPYIVLTHRVAYIYCYILPFGLVSSMGWLTPVITILLGYTFFGLDALSEQLEEPFGNDANDLALDALCRTNEISICESLGDEPPAPVQPVKYTLY